MKEISRLLPLSNNLSSMNECSLLIFLNDSMNIEKFLFRNNTRRSSLNSFNSSSDFFMGEHPFKTIPVNRVFYQHCPEIKTARRREDGPFRMNSMHRYNCNDRSLISSLEVFIIGVSLVFSQTFIHDVTYFLSASIIMASLPSFMAATPVVPDPAKGSRIESNIAPCFM